MIPKVKGIYVMAKSFKSSKIEVRPSMIHGKGVFCVDRICAGEIVWIRGGNVVSIEEANKIDAVLGDFSLQIEEHFFYLQNHWRA